MSYSQPYWALPSQGLLTSDIMVLHVHGCPSCTMSRSLTATVILIFPYKPTIVCGSTPCHLPPLRAGSQIIIFYDDFLTKRTIYTDFSLNEERMELAVFGRHPRVLFGGRVGNGDVQNILLQNTHLGNQPYMSFPNTGGWERVWRTNGRVTRSALMQNIVDAHMYANTIPA